MKQYIMGMITGASLIACVIMFMGATNEKKIGRYQGFANGSKRNLLDTKNGDLFELSGTKIGKKKWFTVAEHYSHNK